MKDEEPKLRPSLPSLGVLRFPFQHFFSLFFFNLPRSWCAIDIQTFLNVRERKVAVLGEYGKRLAGGC
jgi:hypothetical protein